MWSIRYNDDYERGAIRYNGNHITEAELYIFESEIFYGSLNNAIAMLYFDSIFFTNGNATKSFAISLSDNANDYLVYIIDCYELDYFYPEDRNPVRMSGTIRLSFDGNKLSRY